MCSLTERLAQPVTAAKRLMRKVLNRKRSLPELSDFPPKTLFVIKEFNVPLVQIPGVGWINWFGGVPRPYDPRWLAPGNNWQADSFEEWLAVVAEGMNSRRGKRGL